MILYSPSATDGEAARKSLPNLGVTPPKVGPTGTGSEVALREKTEEEEGNDQDEDDRETNAHVNPY